MFKTETAASPISDESAQPPSAIGQMGFFVGLKATAPQ